MIEGERGEILEHGARAIQGTGEQIRLPKKWTDSVDSFNHYSTSFRNKNLSYVDSDGNEITLKSTKTSISICKMDKSGKRSIYKLNHPNDDAKFTLTFGYIGKESNIPVSVDRVHDEILPNFERRLAEICASSQLYAQNAQKDDDADVERLEHLFEEMV